MASAKIFKTVCRTCLSTENITNIFETTCDNFSVVEMLDECTTVQVQPNDRLPQNMCLSCIAILYQTYSFQKMCRKSKETLETILQKEADPVFKDHSYATSIFVIDILNETKNFIKEKERNRSDVIKSKSIKNEQSTDDSAEEIFPEMADEDEINLLSTIQPSNNVVKVMEIPQTDLAEATPSASNVNNTTKILQENINVSKIIQPSTEVTTSAINLKLRNQQLHHQFFNKTVHHCKICSVYVDSMRGMIIHYKNHRKKYGCPLCHKSFIKHDYLTVHLSKHKLEIIDDRYKCVACDEIVNNVICLKQHLKTSLHKEKSSEVCLICSKIFSSKRSLNKHLTLHCIEIIGDNIRCVRCKISFHRDEVKEHFISGAHRKSLRKICAKNNLKRSEPSSATKPILLNCKECNITLVTFDELCNHFKSEHEGATKCIICSREYSTPQVVLSHLYSHTLGRYNNCLSQTPALFSCKECTVPFDTFGELCSHFKSEHEGATKCIICSRRYKRPQAVLSHLYSHSLGRHYCGSCRISFENDEELQKHKQSFEHLHPRKCKICSTEFVTKAKLRKHMTTHGENNTCQCDQCGKIFRYYHNLRRHIALHNGQKRFLCQNCGKRFSTNFVLKKHNESVCQFTGSNCEKCGKRYRSIFDQKLHDANHNFNHRVICRKCMDTFATNHELNSHIKENHEWFECEVCEKIFVNKFKFNQHVKTHGTSQNLRFCSDCNVNFETYNEYKKHRMDCHDTYSCHICNNKYITVDILQKHILTHSSNTERNVCCICGKQFRLRTSLQFHMYVHNQVKPYCCKICKKRFRQGAHLKAHMVLHTGERPYVCKYCNKSYSFHATLVCHERLHTGERPYVCPVCNKGFTHSTTMKRHCVTHYKVNKVEVL